MVVWRSYARALMTTFEFRELFPRVTVRPGRLDKQLWEPFWPVWLALSDKDLWELEDAIIDARVKAPKP